MLLSPSPSGPRKIRPRRATAHAPNGLRPRVQRNENVFIPRKSKRSFAFATEAGNTKVALNQCAEMRQDRCRSYRRASR